QLAEDQRAVRPRACERDIEVVASGLGLEAPLAPSRRSAVCGHPVAPLRILTHEFSAGFLRVIPAIYPFPVDQQSHGASFLAYWTVSSGMHRQTTGTRCMTVCHPNMRRDAAPERRPDENPWTRLQNDVSGASCSRSGSADDAWKPAPDRADG